jgi:hypothetical protein
MDKDKNISSQDESTDDYESLFNETIEAFKKKIIPIEEAMSRARNIGRREAATPLQKENKK